MPFNSIGDLASSLMFNQSSIQAKRSMLKHSQELTTGITTDVGAVLRNDYAQQMSWERRIGSSEVREKTLSEAMTRIQVKQSALGFIGDSALNLANDINLSLTAGTKAAVELMGSSAKDILGRTIARLNVQSAGTTLFAGTQTDGVAMASADDVLASVKTAISGALTISDVIDGVQNWMNDPVSGFQSQAYLGNRGDAMPIRVGQDRLIQEGTRADDPALAKTVQNLILASLSVDQDFALSLEGQSGLLEHAANGLRSAEGQITGLRASLGYVESEISKGRTEAGAEIAMAKQLRATTLGIDEFEVASKIQQAELQLEKIYTLTARSARMSLLEYLR